MHSPRSVFFLVVKSVLYVCERVGCPSRRELERAKDLPSKALVCSGCVWREFCSKSPARNGHKAKLHRKPPPEPPREERKPPTVF